MWRYKPFVLQVPGVDRAPKYPKTCLQCGQSTSDFEMDWLPDKEVFLKWVRFSITPETGERDGDTPDGNECYKCFDSRRKKVGPKTNMESLRQIRKENKRFNEEWILFRRQRVRGEGFYTRPAGDEKIITSEKESEYSKTYVPGRFRRVENYLRDIGFTEVQIEERFGTDVEKMVEFLSQSRGVNPYKSAQGFWGVNISILPEGEFCLELGQESSVIVSTVRDHDDEESAKEHVKDVMGAPATAEELESNNALRHRLTKTTLPPTTGSSSSSSGSKPLSRCCEVTCGAV